MCSPDYAQTMAQYNQWQNRNLIGAASGLSDAERTRDRGAFFGSIAQTFHHLLWGDRIWMSRFAGTEPPEGGIPQSIRFDGGWEAFRAARAELDRVILDWAGTLTPAWFEGELRWFSGALGREISKPRRVVVMHIFNHQTHHRGQIHAMLTAAGARPGDTDLPFMPDPAAAS